VPPLWLTIVAWLALAMSFVCAGLIAYDILGRGNRQRMGIMEVVWPVTALYFGPLAWWGYRRWGRLNSLRHQKLTGRQPQYGTAVSAAIGVTHCGAGCSLGDVVGEWGIFAFTITIAGQSLWPELAADFTCAFALGIGFQYLSIAPMRGLGLRQGVVAALKADTLSLTAFEIGLFGWMALSYFVFFTSPHLEPDHAAYWLLMQVGMVIGFLTAYPANVWLIRGGIKEAM
jgi:hypothetical protein